MSKIYDTLIWEYIKNPWWKWLSLDFLAERYFDYKMISYDEITNKNFLNFCEVDLKKAANYSAEDVYITAKIYDNQKKDWIVKDKILNDIEFPLINVLKNMEITWVKIDINKLNEIWKYLNEEIKKEEKNIFNLAWEEFNIKSSQQVWNILFKKIWLQKWKKTKTGYSVDNEVLENLSFKHPIVRHIVNYRQYTKLQSTYIEWLLKLINKNTWRVHTSYNQTTTTTWRLSSTNPNLQNIPSSTWIWWSIREWFIPFNENDILVSFDYSQIEVRILAIMSWDENLLWNFSSWLDIHATTWYFLFWKNDISNDERRIAKAVNFWIIYWISAFWLAKMIWISQNEASIYINKFYEKYPKVLDFFKKTIEFCEKNWFVETKFWRRRYINSINDSNSIIKKTSEREAINMPIQWTAADIIKLSMIKIDKFLKENKLKSQMIMQVHDELVFNVLNEEFEIIKNEIPNIMENIINVPIKLIVDIWSWKNWKECK